jgi:hypothetical protein
MIKEMIIISGMFELFAALVLLSVLAITNLAVV